MAGKIGVESIFVCFAEAILHLQIEIGRGGGIWTHVFNVPLQLYCL